MDDEQEIKNLRVLLEQVVLDLIDYLSNSEEKTWSYPYLKEKVTYQPAAGNSSKTISVRRPNRLKAEQELKLILDDIPSFADLDKFCKDLIKKYGSYRAIQGSPNAIELIAAYTRQASTKTLKSDKARTLSEKHIASLRDKTKRFRVLTQINGIYVTQPFNIGQNIKLSPIRLRDISKYGIDDRTASRIRGAEWMQEGALLCTVDFRYENTDKEYELAYRKCEELTTSCINALRLSNPKAKIRYVPIRSFHTDNYAVNFESIGGRAIPYQLHPFFSNKATCYKNNEIDLSRKLLSHIEAHNQTKPNNKDEISYALTKFHSTLARTDEVDEIVDIAIGLESLLAGGATSDITYQIKLRGAAILDDTFGSANDRITLLADIYSVRSNIVHGSFSKKAKNLKYLGSKHETLDSKVGELLPYARKAFSSVIIWFLLNKESKKIRRKKSSHISLVAYLDSQLASCEGIERDGF